MLYNRHCRQCGEPFTATRSDALFCSSGCRVAVCRAAKPQRYKGAPGAAIPQDLIDMAEHIGISPAHLWEQTRAVVREQHAELKRLGARVIATPVVADTDSGAIHKSGMRQGVASDGAKFSFAATDGSWQLCKKIADLKEELEGARARITELEAALPDTPRPRMTEEEYDRRRPEVERLRGK